MRNWKIVEIQWKFAEILNSRKELPEIEDYYRLLSICTNSTRNVLNHQNSKNGENQIKKQKFVENR